MAMYPRTAASSPRAPDRRQPRPASVTVVRRTASFHLAAKNALTPVSPAWLRVEKGKWMIRPPLSSALAALALLLAASAANAQTANRAWVSGHGTDTAGCGAPAAPCRSLQFTHDNIVAAGGEIDILDPAGYGSITITKAISIVNDGVGVAGVQAASGNAITINAGLTDKVVLRGLSIEGVGASNGIVLNSGGALSVEDCSIARFSFGGLIFSPSGASFLYLSHSRVKTSTGGGVGIYINPLIASGSPTVRATLDHVEAIDDAQAGVFVDGRQSTQGTEVQVTVADSLLADSATDGIHGVTNSVHATTQTMVRNTTIANNALGVSAEGGAEIFLDRSTVSGNGQAFFIGSGGVIGSYGDNSIDFNDALSPATTPETLH